MEWAIVGILVVFVISLVGFGVWYSNEGDVN